MTTLSKTVVVTIAAVGTFLAGVAAVLAFWIPAAGPAAPAQTGNTTSETDGITDENTVDTLSRMRDLVRDKSAAYLQVSPDGRYSNWQDVASVPFTARVPAVWNAQDFAAWLDDSDNEIGTAILASTRNVEDLYDESAVSGIWISGTVATLDPGELLSERKDKREALCNESEEIPFATKTFTGLTTLWTSCGNGDLAIVDFIANHNVSGATAVVFVKAISIEDVEAFGTVVDGLKYDQKVENNRLGDGRERPGRSRG
jgi:hypothetical protein